MLFTKMTIVGFLNKPLHDHITFRNENYSNCHCSNFQKVQERKMSWYPLVTIYCQSGFLTAKIQVEEFFNIRPTVSKFN